jgi:CheY-like chemotaxis protein
VRSGHLKLLLAEDDKINSELTHTRAAGREQMVILAMTASDLLDEQAQCLEAGMDEVAAKAAEAAALFVTILKWLSRRHG